MCRGCPLQARCCRSRQIVRQRPARHAWLECAGTNAANWGQQIGVRVQFPRAPDTRKRGQSPISYRRRALRHGDCPESGSDPIFFLLTPFPATQLSSSRSATGWRHVTSLALALRSNRGRRSPDCPTTLANPSSGRGGWLRRAAGSIRACHRVTRPDHGGRASTMARHNIICARLQAARRRRPPRSPWTWHCACLLYTSPSPRD